MGEQTNRIKFSFNKNNIKYSVPFIHFVLTFLWERVIFRFSDNWDIWLTIAKNQYVSDTVELGLVYILSHVCAGIIIWLLWKLIFKVYEHKISRNIIGIFGTIFIVGFMIGFFSYPDAFGIEIDNYTNFSMVIRFLPTYWQSIYTGIVYAGCMMVIPHPFSIFIFQWMAFVSVIAYIYTNIEQFANRYKKAKYILLILFLLPESYYLMFNAYRNNFYTILNLFYFSYLLFSAKDKVYNLKKIIIFAVLSGFIMVWRSEGVLIGLGGMILFCLSAYKTNRKKMASGILIFIAAYICFNNCQGIGREKYYGQDYMIINTTNVLYNIFNDPNADLTYEGADADLTAIEAVIPVEVLKELAMRGYRDYNWTSGRADFNQSMASDEAAAAYMSAYYRIIFHNVEDYLDVQFNFLYKSLQLNGQHSTYSYSGDSYMDLEQFNYVNCVWGMQEFGETYLTSKWEKKQIRIFFCSVISYICMLWRELWTFSGLNALLHVVAIISDFLILIIELYKFIKNKGKDNLPNCVLFMILIGEIFAIMLFMPEGRPVYLYPMLYSSYIIIYFYILGLTNDNEAGTNLADKSTQAQVEGCI